MHLCSCTPLSSAAYYLFRTIPNHVFSIGNTSGNILTYYTEHGDEGSPSRELYLETRCIAIWPRSLKFSSTHSKAANCKIRRSTDGSFPNDPNGGLFWDRGCYVKRVRATATSSNIEPKFRLLARSIPAHELHHAIPDILKHFFGKRRARRFGFRFFQRSNLYLVDGTVELFATAQLEDVRLEIGDYFIAVLGEI